MHMRGSLLISLYQSVLYLGASLWPSSVCLVAFCVLRDNSRPTVVAHICNPSYLGGGGRSGGSWIEASPNKRVETLSQPVAGYGGAYPHLCRKAQVGAPTASPLPLVSPARGPTEGIHLLIQQILSIDHVLDLTC
jgi:hypothetical protein